MVEKSKFKEIMLSCVDSIILSDVANIWYCKYSNNRFYTCTSNGQRDFLRVYSYPDFSLLYKYGSKGQGPGEFISVNWAKTQVEDEFILYDIMKKQLHVFRSGDTVPTKIGLSGSFVSSSSGGMSKSSSSVCSSPKISSNLSNGITNSIFPFSGANIFTFSSCFSGFNNNGSDRKEQYPAKVWEVLDNYDEDDDNPILIFYTMKK
jgi:hypothetical protein